MSLGAVELDELADRACAAARAAARYLLSARPNHIEHKSDGGSSVASTIVTEMDRRSQEIILAELRPATEAHDLGLLSEEGPSDRSRFHKDYFWCIDPLDGTLPFVEGEDSYAISIALVRRDGHPLVGTVLLPAKGEHYLAVAGRGALLNGAPLSPPTASDDAPLQLFVDRSFIERDDVSRTRQALDALAEARGLSGVELKLGGAAVSNACSVLSHANAAYPKRPKKERGGGSLWDFAATACLFRELALPATDMLGNALDLNRQDSTFMNHRGILYASDHSLARELRQLFAELAGPAGSEVR